jgi:histidyl-tRNA synthetase
VHQLRAVGISAELYPSSAKLKKQMLYAHKKGVAFVVLIGSEELEQNQFVVKNMQSGEQSTHAMADLLSVFASKN